MSREAADGSGSGGMLGAVFVCPGLGHGRGPGRGAEVEGAGIHARLFPLRAWAGWRGAPGCSGR
jgi:hypothetical protein